MNVSYLIISRKELEKILAALPAREEACAMLDLRETRDKDREFQQNIEKVTICSTGQVLTRLN